MTVYQLVTVHKCSTDSLYSRFAQVIRQRVLPSVLQCTGWFTGMPSLIYAQFSFPVLLHVLICDTVSSVDYGFNIQ